MSELRLTEEEIGILSRTAFGGFKEVTRAIESAVLRKVAEWLAVSISPCDQGGLIEQIRAAAEGEGR